MASWATTIPLPVLRGQSEITMAALLPACRSPRFPTGLKSLLDTSCQRAEQDLRSKLGAYKSFGPCRYKVVTEANEHWHLSVEIFHLGES